MSDENQSENPIDALAEEFVARFRKGEQPSLSEYTARYPHLAGEIHELFPALIMMEKARPAEPGQAHGADPLSSLGTLPERLNDYLIVQLGYWWERCSSDLGLDRNSAVGKSELTPIRCDRDRASIRPACDTHRRMIVLVLFAIPYGCVAVQHARSQSCSSFPRIKSTSIARNHRRITA